MRPASRQTKDTDITPTSLTPWWRGEELFEEIFRNPVPIEMHTLKALKGKFGDVIELLE